MTTVPATRVGLVGLGALGREVHLPLLRGLPRFEVVAVADPDRTALDRAAAVGGRETASSADPMALCRGEVVDLDAVVVASPTRFHAEQAGAALRAGMHVYLEKPVASTRAQAEELLRVQIEPQQVFQVGFNYRHDPAYSEIARRVDVGALGTVLEIEMMFHAPLDPQGTWRSASEPGGGVLPDLFSHDVDLLGVLGFQFENLGATGDGESATVAGTLQGRSSTQVGFEGHYSYRSVDRARCRLKYDHGVLSYDRYRDGAAVWHPAAGAPTKWVAALFNAVRQARALPTRLERRRSPWDQPSYRSSLLAFRDAVCGRRHAQGISGASLTDGVRSLRVVDAAQRSLREGGRRVSVAPEQTRP